jgi:hypothetical protein
MHGGIKNCTVKTQEQRPKRAMTLKMMMMTGRTVLYACAERGNLPLTSCPCRVRFMLYFETQVFEFSGMVGYSDFRVRPDLHTESFYST